MVRGAEEHRWWHTAAVVCQIANANRNEQHRAEPWEWWEWHPFHALPDPTRITDPEEREAFRNSDENRAAIADLKALFTRGQ